MYLHMNPAIVIDAIGDPTRRTLLGLLRKQKMSVGEIAARLPVSRPAVSQHLRVLKEAELVKEQREGTRHYFTLNPEGFADLRHYIDSMWQDALQSFAAYVHKQKSSRPRAKEKKRRRRNP